MTPCPRRHCEGLLIVTGVQDADAVTCFLCGRPLALPRLATATDKPKREPVPPGPWR